MKDETNDAERLDDYSYTTIQLGVWRMLLPVELTSSQWSPLARFPLSRLGKWDGLSPALLIWRFVREVYSIDPWLNLMLFALTLASAVEGTLLLYASSRLLRTASSLDVRISKPYGMLSFSGSFAPPSHRHLDGQEGGLHLSFDVGLSRILVITYSKVRRYATFIMSVQV
ncbi:hypothetical protein B0H16DRAFT_180163 [Mycena metata]|uniref:Uncharacterized protein n=1 Tax=Mycena metata TaxID=1033252 RepID=A0AAD7I018_9AGAR|nr:hypothetical protein B0H16DRAFT_180163 [Mycena metata]